jgi:hypothetical protein
MQYGFANRAGLVKIARAEMSHKFDKSKMEKQDNYEIYHR